jgi:hypothetical protein
MLSVIGGLVRAHDRAMAEVRQGCRDLNLDQALSGLERLAPRGSEIILASALDQPGSTFDDLIGALTRRCRVCILQVGEADLDRLPPGSYPVTGPDGGTTRIRYGGGLALSRHVAIDGCRVFQLDAGTDLPQGLREAPV